MVYRKEITSDTLKALSMITVTGHIENLAGHQQSDFNGVIVPLVYGKPREVQTLANDGGQKMIFELQNNILFSGKTSVENGRFRFTFIVPRDIDYSYGQGKISYYASDGSYDMNGSFSDFVVGGFSNTDYSDTSGPDIRLFLNDTLFRSGGITDKNPRLLALIEDEGGINTSGTGLGHDLLCWLDNDRNRSFILNNYYENDFDNYNKGKVIYDFSELAGGKSHCYIKSLGQFQ